ncbi:hypothetical protein HERIO_2334 [Hepatospora eriocheir]|uniref:Uncharacterized protein n=1 Tax=Hepatospora eriocheir TaxID=1081669 RepID=A0A1X0Q7B0_9MICR|nr:hypothetical protein HERIO_2334 [Hepatospora eriocheir]
MDNSNKPITFIPIISLLRIFYLPVSYVVILLLDYSKNIKAVEKFNDFLDHFKTLGFAAVSLFIILGYFLSNRLSYIFSSVFLGLFLAEIMTFIKTCVKSF